MHSTVRFRRRATAIAVPGAMVIIVAGAFLAAPAFGVSPSSTALPFPTVCSSGQSSSSSASASASSSSATPSATGTPTPSASATGTATAKANSAKTGSAPSASASGTGTSSATGGSSASPSATPSASSSSGGFWGWLNGVWTFIFSDAQYVGHSGAVAAAAPRDGGVHFEDAANSTGTSSSSSTSTSATNCLSSASAAALKAKAQANGTSEGVYAGTIPWVMKTPSTLMYDLTYNGVKTVSVWNSSSGKYEDEQVLDFTMSKITITSMVTYSIYNGQTVYNNAGSGTTTTLINVHLMVRSMTSELLGLLPQTYTPSNQPPLPVGLTIPLIPILFTNVTTQIAYLSTGSISIPGFDGFANNGIASPQ